MASSHIRQSRAQVNGQRLVSAGIERSCCLSDFKGGMERDPVSSAILTASKKGCQGELVCLQREILVQSRIFAYNEKDSVSHASSKGDITKGAYLILVVHTIRP